MTPREDKERARETVPSRLPETTPPVYPGQDYSFTLQAVFEMQGKLGKLEHAIETLTEQSKANTQKLDHVSKVIYAAGTVLTVFGIIGGWVLSKAWELIVPLLQVHKP